MRTCEQCGLSMGDAATFCTVCGAHAGSPESTAGPAPETPAAPTDTSAAEPTTETDASPAELVAGAEDGASPGGGDAASRRLQEAALPMYEAGRLETLDPARALQLYRDAALRFLEAAAEPLDQEGVRHDLAFIFDRMSLVLEREGQPAEALEEVDSAASLGLLDCQDHGITGHRDALRARRESLHRALDEESPPTP